MLFVLEEIKMRFYNCFLVVTLCVLAFDDGSFFLLSNGGVTSSYVRNKEKSGDMPFDSDVFKVPQGYNAPQQVILLPFELLCNLQFLAKILYNLLWMTLVNYLYLELRSK